MALLLRCPESSAFSDRQAGGTGRSYSAGGGVMRRARQAQKPPLAVQAQLNIDKPQRVIRYFANPSAPSPAGSIFTAFTSAIWSFAFGPVSKMTVVPSSDAKLQLAS